MRSAWPLSALALAMSQLLMILPAKAAIFPDVSDGYMYQAPIESLVGLKVINGNPDGSFQPEKSVNRAELLAMLYRATNKTPDGSKRGCFPDVQPGSWYELYVCDAAAKHYVNGYSDGMFRPNKEVNRVEALKMIATVFKMNVSEVQGQNLSIIKFVDTSTSAWYTKYLYNAFAMSILPIAGMDTLHFMPEAALKRGEAAAYIYNALHAMPRQVNGSSSSAAVMSASSATRSSRSAAAEASSVSAKALTIPSSLSANFQDKAPDVYRFTLNAATQVAIDVTLGGSFTDQGVTCRLYHLDSSGFANEFYLGYQQQNVCQLRTKLSTGDYQLQIQAPTAFNAVYALSIKIGKGDGNDGFSEAKTLLPNKPKSDFLDIGDMADWFKFSLTAPKQMTLGLISDGTVGCIVYPMNDVDIYGFSEPDCNQTYLFPKGTYYLGVFRKNDRHDKATYTLQMQ